MHTKKKKKVPLLATYTRHLANFLASLNLAGRFNPFREQKLQQNSSPRLVTEQPCNQRRQNISRSKTKTALKTSTNSGRGNRAHNRQPTPFLFTCGGGHCHIQHIIYIYKCKAVIQAFQQKKKKKKLLIEDSPSRLGPA